MSCHARQAVKIQDVDLIVAVAGQPNVGKSTLLNRLVGPLSHVGNWPGKTVDIFAGVVEYNGYRMLIVDLPGTYGLSGVTEEEEIARKYILGEVGEKAHKHRRSVCERCILSFACPMPRFCPARVFGGIISRRRKEHFLYTPDVVLVIVDATALERTMYLAISILEVFPHVVIAINKMDEARERGIYIDVEALSKKLGVPVVAISALKKEGFDSLLNAVIDVWRRRALRRKPLRVDYGILEYYIERVEKIIHNVDAFKKYPTRWIALRILERDKEIFELLRTIDGKIETEVEKILDQASKIHNGDFSAIISSAKYNFISELLRGIIKVSVEEKRRELLLSWIDRIFLKPLIGPLAGFSVIFITMLLAFTINTGFPFNLIFAALGYDYMATALEEYSIVSLLDLLFSYIIDIMKKALAPLPRPWPEFITDGMIGGVALILTFVPLIFFVLFLLSLLEDSGLSARIAVSLDSTFSRLGLSGKAAFPMFIGLGCNVPGVMSSRTLMSKGEKLAVILATPFVICQARLIVLTAIVSIAFINPIQQAFALVSILILSIILYALIASLFVRIFGERAEKESELIIDFPPLRKPSLRVAWWNAWILTKHFIKKAGTIIFVLSMIIWFLLNYGPLGYTTNASLTYGAMLGRILSPIALIWGVSNPETSWKLMFAFAYGIIAKEGLLLAIATLLREGSFEAAWLSFGLTPLQSYAILIAMMTYIPCLATIITIKHETKSWKLTIFSATFMIFLAVALSSLIYWIGHFLGLG